MLRGNCPGLVQVGLNQPASALVSWVFFTQMFSKMTSNWALILFMTVLCFLWQVISGHLGWVRSIAVEPGNQWFVTGSADRTIKVSLGGNVHLCIWCRYKHVQNVHCCNVLMQILRTDVQILSQDLCNTLEHPNIGWRILLKNNFLTSTDLGPVQWEAEAVPHGTHQHRARRGRQHSQPVPVLMWRRQASQVLGSGVQQGTMRLQARVLPLRWDSPQAPLCNYDSVGIARQFLYSCD